MCWRQQLSKKERQTIADLNRKKQLLINDYRELIQSLPRSVKTIELAGGGEPLMFKHIKELIHIIKEKNILLY